MSGTFTSNSSVFFGDEHEVTVSKAVLRSLRLDCGAELLDQVRVTAVDRCSRHLDTPVSDEEALHLTEQILRAAREAQS